MLRRTAIAALVATAFAAPALAARPAAPQPEIDLGQAIELVAQEFPGRTIAAQVDPVGGESVHYHIDVLMPTGRVAKLDVDARTRKIVSRMPPEETSEGVISLGDAVRATQRSTKGRVVSAEYDPDPRPHYHMNVRLPKGKLARYDLDLETRSLAAHARR